MMAENELIISKVTVYRNQSGHTLPVLNHIDLRIAEGEWVNIVGPNGSGKSTLAQLIAGIQSIHSGTLERGFLPDVVPYVMQQHYCIGDTPWEDIIFQLEMRGEDPLQIPSIAHQALLTVGLDNLMHRPFAELSGGQKQLAAIAGCIAAKAPLLLLDEATSMLDSTSRKVVLETVQTIHRQGVSVIWLTHHMEELAAGTRVIGLMDGKITFDGPTTSFFYGGKNSRDSLLEPELSYVISTGLTPCEQLGFEPPYPVQVARELIKQGVHLDKLPLTAEQLVEAVHKHAR